MRCKSPADMIGLNWPHVHLPDALPMRPTMKQGPGKVVHAD